MPSYLVCVPFLYNHHVSSRRLVILFSLFYTWRMWGLAEVNWLAQSPISDQWQSQNANSHLLDSKAGGFQALYLWLHFTSAFPAANSYTACTFKFMVLLLASGISAVGDWRLWCYVRLHHNFQWLDEAYLFLLINYKQGIECSSLW